MIQVLVQITSAGASLTGGTFTVMAYNNGVMVQILAVGVTLAALQAGITYTNVPIGSTHIRIQATNGPSGCTNYVDQAIVFQTTTTTTSTTTLPPTTTTTTTEVPTTTTTTTQPPCYTVDANVDAGELAASDDGNLYIEYVDCDGNLHERGDVTYPAWVIAVSGAQNPVAGLCAQSITTYYTLVGGLETAPSVSTVATTLTPCP